MKRAWMKTAAAILVVAVVGGALCAGESPFVGNWKVHNVASANEPVYVVVQVEAKDGKLQAKALASPLLNNSAAIEKFQADAKSMQFEIRAKTSVYPVKVYAPKGEAAPTELLGSITSGGRIALARLSKTEDTDLTVKDAQKVSADGKALTSARKVGDPKEQREALQEIVEKYADKPAAYSAMQLLLQTDAKAGAKDMELSALAAKFVKLGARYGPEVEKNTELVVCQTLARAEKITPFAIDYVSQTEKALTKNDSLTRQTAVLKLLASVYRRTDKQAEAHNLQTRIEKLEEPLDAEFTKSAVPFQTTEYKGRKGDSKRIAVVELFTGAYCPPCVAADIAFDAVLKSYVPKDVVMLQYHTHIPLSDRLTNADTEVRLKYYKKSVRGVPTAFLNGKATKGLGGYKMHGENSYKTLRGAIDEALETDSAATVLLRTERKGDQIDIRAQVSNVPEPGENMRLRFVLIEEVVRYPGGNGQRLHHHVVRAMPGGADGFPLKDAKVKQNASINLIDLKKSLDAYMTKYNQGARPFVDDEYPLNIHHLKIVALIQDDASQEILQAAEVNVPEDK